MLILLASCKTSASRDTAKMTDFRVGRVYQLEQEAFILAHTGLLMTVEEAQQKRPAAVESLLAPGTQMTVRQIVLVNDRSSGPRADVYAEIISGPRAGRVVNVRTASLRDSATGATRRDPAVLQMVH